MFTLALVISAVVCTLGITLLVLNLAAAEKHIKYQILTTYGVRDSQFKNVMGQLLGPSLIDGNQVTGLLNGDEIFPAMLAAIRESKKTICFETYIYWSGSIGKEFADALCERSANGVKVHVLLDWLGSNKIDEELLVELRGAGVEVERYRPLRWYNLARMNHRTHRKLLVVAT